MADWYKEIEAPSTKASDYWYREMTPELKTKAGPTPTMSPIIDDPNKMASTTALVGASLPTDPIAKARFYASRRFPGDKKALSRYGISDGRIFYTDKGGQRYFEEPKAALPTSVDNVRRLAGSVVGSTGDALSMGGGIIGGLATPGVGGGVPGAVAGGSAADALRQMLASSFAGEEKSMEARALQSGLAGLVEGGGQGVGLLGARALGRLGKTPTFDLSGSEELGQAARRMDIPLTIAEETGHPSLVRRQKILGSTTSGEEVFNEFYAMRNEKVRDALADYLSEVSMIRSVSEGSKGGVEGARASIKAEKTALQDEARPYYEAARESGVAVDVGDLYESVESQLPKSKGGMSTALKKIKGWLTDADGAPETDVEALHNTKLAIDEMLENPRDSGIGRTTARAIRDIKEQLVKAIEDASPDYAKGREIYEEGRPALTTLEKSAVGDLSKLEGRATHRAASTVFNSRVSSPETVAQARDAFLKAGQEDQWNGLVRAHLEDALESIPENAYGITNIGGSFAKSIWGNSKKRRMMDEALRHTPEVAENLKWMMKVLQATGRAAKGESITAFAQAGQKELEKEARGFLPAAVEGIQFWQSPSRISQYIADVRTGKYAKKMSELMVSPEGKAHMRELRQLDPRSRNAIIAASHLMVAGGLDAAIPAPANRTSLSSSASNL